MELRPAACRGRNGERNIVQRVGKRRVSGYVVENFPRSMRHPASGGFEVRLTGHDTQIGESHRLHRARSGANILCSLFNQLAR
ncbi:hypothetical protein D3C76_1380120 [compost metagenome]